MTPIIVRITLKAPLSHGSLDAGDIGNATAIRRLPIAGIVGHPRVPVLSGAALRGRIRRVLFRDLLDHCGIDRELRGYDRLYAALANGGHLERSEASVRPEARRALREALPPLGALGAALYAYMLEGRVQVGWCWPVCAETVEAGLVPAPAGGAVPAEDLVTEITTTRHVDRGEHDPAASGVTPMPTTVEALIPGAVLVSRITGTAEPVAASSIAWALDRIDHLGSKVGSGMGAVEISHDGDPAPYAAWRGEHREQAREALIALAAGLAR